MTESTRTEFNGAAPAAGSAVVDEQLVSELVARASAEGVSLTGEGGLLQQLTKRVLESSLEGEMDAHLGYGKHEAAGRDGGNSRNGKRSKTVLTGSGRCSSTYRATGMPAALRRSSASGSGAWRGWTGSCCRCRLRALTTGEISAHLAEVYGASVSKETISAITDRVLDAMAEWQNRPLDAGWFLANVANQVVVSLRS